MTATADRTAVIDLREIWIEPHINGRSDGYQRDQLASLMQSIEATAGITTPITICLVPDMYKDSAGDKKYMLVAGFRRSYSCMHLAEDNEDDNWYNVPALVKAENDPKSIVLNNLAENFSRVDMSPWDIATQMEILATEHGMTNKGIAAAMGCDPTNVTHYRKLLKLPESVLSMIREGKVSYSHARLLGRVDTSNVELVESLAKQAASLSFGKFKEVVDDLTEDKDGGDEEGEEKGASSDQQRSSSLSVRPKNLEVRYIPMLKRAIADASDDSVKARLLAMEQALEFVLKGESVAENPIVQAIKPYLEEEEKAKREKEAEERNSEIQAYWTAANIKYIKNRLDVRNVAEGQVRPTAAQALSEIKTRLATELSNGKVTFTRKELVKDDEGNVVKGEDGKDLTKDTVLSFPFTGTVDSLAQFIAQQWNEYVKRNQENKANRDAKKKKKKEEEAAAAGAGAT